MTWAPKPSSRQRASSGPWITMSRERLTTVARSSSTNGVGSAGGVTAEGPARLRPPAVTYWSRPQRPVARGWSRVTVWPEIAAMAKVSVSLEP